MEEGLIALAATAGGIVLKTWGVYGIVILLLGSVASLLGYLWLRSDRATRTERAATQAEREKNDALQLRLYDLQEKRLQDAIRLTTVIDNATATIASRSVGDQRWTEVHAVLVDKVSALEATLASLEALLTRGRPRTR